MTRSLTVLLAALIATAAAASAGDFETRLEKKLGSEFLKKAEWVVDYDAALAASKTSGKPIFAYFTVSFFD